MTRRSSAGARILKRRGVGATSSAPARDYTARVPLQTPADVTIRRLAGEPGQHCFGYYDKCPWDASGRYVLGMQAAFLIRQPRPDDVLRLGLIDLHRSQGFEAFAETGSQPCGEAAGLGLFRSDEEEGVAHADAGKLAQVGDRFGGEVLCHRALRLFLGEGEVGKPL